MAHDRRRRERPAGAVAQADENRQAYNLSHGDVVDGDIFDRPAVNGLNGQALTIVEDAVADGDVDEAAIGFGAKFNAPGARRAGWSARGFGGWLCVRAVLGKIAGAAEAG